MFNYLRNHGSQTFVQPLVDEKSQAYQGYVAVSHIQHTQIIPHSILVGSDSKSNAQMFYNSANKQLIGARNFCLDSAHPLELTVALLLDRGPRHNTYDTHST